MSMRVFYRLLLIGMAITLDGKEFPMTSQIVTWPAPATEPASPDYTLAVEGTPVFVYQTRVRAEILPNDGLWTHRPDCPGERASFAIFDIREPVTVTIHPQQPVTSATVLPARANVTATIKDGSTVSFKLTKAQPITVLFNGSAQLPLHLFVGEPEQNVPAPGDRNVVYFGPGLHEITEVKIKSGQTVYLAGGAVVKGVLRPGEKGDYNEKWKVTFFNGVLLNADGVKNVRICGRGILDASLVPHPGRNMIAIRNSHHVQLSGITLRDASNWNVHISESANVDVDDLRIISGRLNTDGINSTNSRDIRIRRCFVRNHDDSIVVKTLIPDKPCEHIRVEDCVIWSDWGYALGATYETRAPIRDLRFRRCDVLAARHWVIGVHLSDGATVSDIKFQDIEVADLKMPGKRTNMPEEPALIRMVIQADVWGHDSTRGHIRDIVVEHVTVDGPQLPGSSFYGADATHAIENVTLRDIHLRGQPPLTDIQALGAHHNEFARGLRVVAE